MEPFTYCLIVGHLLRWSRQRAAATMVAMTRTAQDIRERERMVAFALRWMPYGGGPAEEILVDFGVAPRTYFTRLEGLLTDSTCPVELERTRIDALLAVCRRRLWLDE